MYVGLNGARESKEGEGKRRGDGSAVHAVVFPRSWVNQLQ